jgi:hypothetical protein
MIRLFPGHGPKGLHEREDGGIIANGGHEGIGAEDWIDLNQLKAEAAELFDISQSAVSQAVKNISEMSESDKLLIPDHLQSRTDQADFRKLSSTGQDRVRQGEPLNRVATYPESLGDFFQQL